MQGARVSSESFWTQPHTSDLEMLLSPMLNAFVLVKCFCPPDWISCLEGRVADREAGLTC